MQVGTPLRLEDRLDYTVRRHFVDSFHFHHVPSLPASSRVLDLGGNKIRKRGQFDIGIYGFSVIYADLVSEKRPDVQADSARIPFPDRNFDAVICSELLEHVPSPHAVLNEVHRILSPGGVLLICVPFLYRIHGDPYDFGRYTDEFWLRTLRDIGFRDIVIERQGLFFSVLTDFIKQYLSEVGLRGRRWTLLRRPIRWTVARFQHWALKHEQKPHVESDPFLSSFTTGFGIVAVRAQ